MWMHMWMYVGILWALVMSLILIFAIIGVFKWRKAQKNGLIVRNRGRVNNRRLFDEDFYEKDDLCTNPIYSNLGCNVYNNDPFGDEW